MQKANKLIKIIIKNSYIIPYITSDTEIFHVLLATSDDSGNYILEDVCEGRNYTFTSSTPGYIAEEVVGVNGERNVDMEKFSE